ncbi:hypothetical protein CANTEDRAFT_113038 [Yamadazyma tenuis ATCC 10573]|uniref:Uncharacterized protein n=3 Tax=Candida tenuis TaxID=2315449 RepID=G3B052_CANTC|nr:uncharacterized protein CANTEDRAFT_113038 [Yamadazyma tenuis ATCC 10573]XP_006685187.1 uncharacterized protein CANTEDRAFT_113038 [Yamadazyma tenuis ATCC 10573]EGV65500.1 hypothetical protein CANTEDRAFT_113038 [Yamadazyma tenuis ATCC 10573]EGV65501.1 hypothetical protein CANTEDRAFT_113038 [Yamadazyma tenuis ATCC 10573]
MSLPITLPSLARTNSNSRDFPRSVPTQSSISDRFRPSLVEMYKFHDSISTSTNNSIFSNSSSISSIASQRDNSIGSIVIPSKSLTPPPPVSHKMTAYSPITRSASSSNLPVHKVTINSLLKERDESKRRKLNDD